MSLNVPTLGYTSPLVNADDPASPMDESHAPARVIVGFDGLTLDGKPFPYATAGDWVLTFSDDGLAILNIPIVVTLPKDPKAA